MSRYDYKELRQAAVKPSATPAEREALADWLNAYDPGSWNGEYYDIDDGLRLFPIYKEVGPDEYTIVDYEIR